MKAVVRQFGEVRALDGIDLEIQSGEFFSLLGPSGCGKTTLLRIIAGLDHPDQGELEICGSNAEGIPAHRRPVNTVFQSYALFPHLDVWHNIAFGLRMKGVPVPEQETRVRQVMEMVQIAPLAHRRPAQLSGGQKQRVALARAIVNEPKVLLLDEPLGALDLKLRKELQVELHQLQRRLGITFIYVTHDQEEALTMSDRIAVMNCGRIEQMDRSAELYERPNTRFVAQFLGSCNLIQATTVDRGLTGLWLESEVGRLRLTSVLELTPLEKRGQLTLAIRPEKIQLLAASKPSVENTITVRIEDIIYSGAETQYLLKAGPIPLRVCSLNARAGASQFFEGQTVQAVLPASELVVLED